MCISCKFKVLRLLRLRALYQARMLSCVYQVVQSLRQEKHQTGVCSCKGLVPRSTVTLNTLLLQHSLTPTSSLHIPAQLTHSHHPLYILNLQALISPIGTRSIVSITSCVFPYRQLRLPVGFRPGNLYLERSQRYSQRHHQGQVRR